MRRLVFLPIMLWGMSLYAQNTPPREALKINLNETGSRFVQFSFLNQVWLRYNQSNPGTLVQGKERDNSFDIGLRRTRFLVLGQLTEKVFVFFQFGMNNFNAQYNTTSNRKLASFFHDAICEYKVSEGNQLRLGAGLSIANGLSRFSQPGVASIMTLDVPIFAQPTVDQTDQFGRKLSFYARGQVGKFDYRFLLSDPFPVASTGATLPAIASNANFAQLGHNLQPQAYIMYQFFDHENAAVPYMTGTYLGKKKIFNIAAGGMYQQDAMWKKGADGDTVYQPMKHVAVESFLDMPVGGKHAAISAYAGYFNMNYGTNYLRYNAPMNPANGSNLDGENSITGHGVTYGNTYPMFGTGQVIYSQAGYLLPTNSPAPKSRWMPYASFTAAKFDRLNGLWTNTFNAGVNCFLNGHQSKLTLDWQNRATYEVAEGAIVKGKRLNAVILQYQVSF